MNHIILAACAASLISLAVLKADGAIITINYDLIGVSQVDAPDSSIVDLVLSGPVITSTDPGDPLDIDLGDTITATISAAALWSVDWVPTLNLVRSFDFAVSTGTLPGGPPGIAAYSGGGFSGGGPVAGPVSGGGAASTGHFELRSSLAPPLDPSANFDFTTFSMSFEMPVTADYTPFLPLTASAEFSSLGNNFDAEDSFDPWVTSASSNVIPEPSTIAIWSLLGLVGAGVQMRRKRKAA